MLDLPTDFTKVTKATDSLSSHNLRTPLHQLFHIIALLRGFYNELRVVAAKIEEKKLTKKNLSSPLTPLTLRFKLTLNLVGSQINALSMLEQDQDGKPLSIQFKTKLSQFNSSYQQLKIVRKKQSKLLNDFRLLDAKTIKKDLLSIIEQFDSNLTKAKDSLGQLCKEGGIDIETTVQGPALPLASNSVKVLVVEDNEINMKLLVTMLQKKKYICTPAVNGAEAVKLFEPGKFDIILMDILMPVLDGYAATREIRLKEEQAKSDSRVPIIAVTANKPTEAKQTAIEAGMDDFLSKPFLESALDLLFVKHLNKEPLSPVSTPEQPPRTAPVLPTDDLKLESSGSAKRSASAPLLPTVEPSDTPDIPISSSPKSSSYIGNFFNQLSSREKSNSYLSTLSACR